MMIVWFLLYLFSINYDKSDDEKTDDQSDKKFDDSDSDPWSKGEEDVTFDNVKPKQKSHPHPAFNRRNK